MNLFASVALRMDKNGTPRNYKDKFYIYIYKERKEEWRKEKKGKWRGRGVEGKKEKILLNNAGF